MTRECLVCGRVFTPSKYNRKQMLCGSDECRRLYSKKRKGNEKSDEEKKTKRTLETLTPDELFHYGEISGRKQKEILHREMMSRK